MEHITQSHRPRCASRTLLATSNGNSVFIHPILLRPQLHEIERQIDLLEGRLVRATVRARYADGDLFERLEPEVRIVKQISLLYEQRSRLQLTFGHSYDALLSLVQAASILFSGNCWILNTMIGIDHPNVDSLRHLEHRCCELCAQHPELWPAYRESNMTYLLENQYLWPCE